MNSVSFHWPHLLWLVVIPLAGALAELMRRSRRTSDDLPKVLRAEAAHGQLSLLSSMAVARPSHRRARWLLWLGLAFVAVALARPQWGELEEQVFDQSREILIAVDLSRSMLAPDVAPSRLDRAKLLITSLLERLEGERVGLIVFAGTAFLQSPLSADYEILREFLPALDPDFLPEGGTNYAALLQTALDAFSEGTDADRFLIVLSDGESTVEDWEKLATTLRERSVKVLSLGVGTAQGAMLPDGSGGFVKDERGAVVLSRLNPNTLEELAQRTGGVYRDASSWVDLASLLEQTVEAGRQGEFAETSRVRRVERFQWALAPALLLLLASYWREFPVHPHSRAMRLTATSPQRPAPPTQALVRSLTLLALFTCGLATAPISVAAPASEPQANPFAAPLAETVGRLAAQPSLSASNLAELAQTTVTYGERMLGAQQNPEPGAIRDALAAVEAGEKQDPKAADWPKLREQLEGMLPPESQEQPDPQQQDQSNPEQDQQKQSQQGDRSSDQNQSKSQEGESEKNDSSEKSEADGDPSQQSQSDQQNGDSSENSGEQPEGRPDGQGESAFGKMNEPPPSPSEQRDPSETQKVGGQSDRRPNNENRALTVPLQKLEQLKQQDSPAKLYQLMQDPNARPSNKGRDW